VGVRALSTQAVRPGLDPGIYLKVTDFTLSFLIPGSSPGMTVLMG
jgi:hypothetical protein